MGQIIRWDAAAEDILSDAKLTAAQARARGGEWQVTADARLGAILSLADAVRERLEEAVGFTAPANRMLQMEVKNAEALVGRIADGCWVLAGRPVHDPALDVLFGRTVLASARIEDHADRLELLEDLLAKGAHPRIPKDRAEAYSLEVGRASKVLRELIDAIRPLRARVALAEEMQRAVALSAHAALTCLKRGWKADGKREAEIHELIPDHEVSAIDKSAIDRSEGPD